MDRITNYALGIVLFFLFFISPSFSQTIDFESLSNYQGLGLSYSEGGFTFSINDPGNDKQIIARTGVGYESSKSLYDNNLAVGAINTWTIIKNDGTEFQFKNIYLQDAGFASTSGTIQGFKNGSAVTAKKSINFNGYKDYSSDADFFDVDEIRIEALDINFYLDQFVYGPVPPPNTPPTASSFTAANGPYENLTYTFSTSMFGYSDIDGDPLSHILIESLPASGVLFLDINDNNVVNSGEEVAVNQQIGKAGLDGGRLKYIQNGSTNTSFQFEVNDGTVNSSGNYVASLNGSPVPTVTLSLTPTSKSESLLTNSLIRATLSNVYGAPVTVNLGFSGAATGSGVDYSVSGTSITINPGNTTGTVILSNVPDALYEGNETVIIDITSVTNGVENGVQQQTFTIIDDDPVPTVSLEVLGIYNPITDESGGQAYVRAKLDAIAGTTVTVPLSFSGTASGGGTDYSVTGTTITLSSGETMDSIRVTSQYDGIEEGDETIIIDMGTPTNGIKGTPDQVTLTIKDEDLEAPKDYTVEINQDPITPSNSSNVSFSFTNAEIGSTYNYLFTSSAGGSSVSGSGTISSTDQTISNIDLSGMSDGTITLSVDLTDSFNNTGATVDDTADKLASAPPFLTGVPTDITVNEGVASNIDLSGTTFGDPDAAADDVLSISYLSLGGTLSFSPGVGVTISQPIPGAWTTSGTISNLNTYLSDPTSIKYTSNPGVIGDNAGSIGLSGSDGLVGASFGTINIDVEPAPYIGYISVPANGTYIAGNNLDFLVNFSEAVTISGSPEITLVIGGNIRAASYVSGSGSTSLFFRYTVATGDLDTDGVEVTEVYLNGGTIQNSSGINANLTLNNVGSTSGVLVDAVAPFGYNVAFDLLGEILINPINVTIIEFRGTGLEVGTTLHYSFTSSGGGTPVTGTESVVTTAQTFDNGGAGYDLSGLTDGTITLTIYLVDAAGNQGSNVSDTETKDTGAPSGYSVAWNDALINAIEASNTSFTVSNAEVGATVFYSISSAGDGNTATVSGSKAVVNSSQVVNVDVSSLVDGSLTVVVYLQDGVGNVGVNETDNSTVLDQTNPVSSIPDLTPASDTGLSDSDNITSDDTPELTGNTESNATVTIYADAAELGSTTSDGAGNWTFTPASAIAEGTYDITAIATDLAGNTGSASGALTVTIDMMAPNPPDPIGVTEDTGLSNTDYITSDNTLIFYGTSEPNSIVTIAVTGSTGPFTTTTDGSGNWLYDNTANSLSEGLHELYAYSTDLAGNVGAVSYVLEIIIDTQAPPAPSTPDLAPGSDSGVSDSDNITNDLTPTFTGTALPGSAVTVISNVDGALGVTTANGSGNWTFTAGSNVSTGVHVIRATQADLAGNNSTVSSGLSVTFDVNPPFLNLEGRHTTYLNANGITPQVKVGDLLLSGMFDDYTPSSLIKTSLSKSVFNCSDIGANPVDVIATDLAGNSFTQSVIIRVVDNIKPTILAKSTITLNVDAFGIVDLTAGMVDEGSFDNCSILSQVLSKTLFDKTDEGSNTVKYTVTDVNGNSSEVDIEVIIVVVPKILNVTVDLGQTKIYGDADPIFTYTATGFEAGDDVGSIMTGALSRDPGKDVGTYSITLGTLDAGPNYTINFTGADFEITPATLNVFTFNYSKVYGDADPTFSFAASGLKNGDPGSIITGALVRVAGEDVGTYAINQGTLDAGSNYTINFTSRNLVITPATLNVTANAGQSKVYGDTDPVFTFQYSGLKNGDTDVVITGSLARASGEDVGMYPINVGTLDAGPNYTVNFTSADFEVTPATLDITADAGQSKVYGDTDPVFTYQYSGLKNGDTDAVFTGELQRASGEDIGTYPINQGTLDAGSNYTINYTGADFTIGEKILTVTVDGGQSKIYGDADPVFTFVADGFEGGDDLSILTGTLSRATGEDVGTYPITLGTLDAGPNYTINFLGSDFEITQATLDITADAGQSKIYGDADPEFTFVADGFEGGDDETILTGALTRAAGEDVGTYAINLGTLDAGPNYTINFTSADFEITPATLDITADGGQSKVYGDADPVFTYQYSGLKNGDTDAVITGSLTRVAGEDVGMYAIQPGTIAAGPNYTVNFTSADFAITPATLVITADAGQSKVYGEADPVFTYQSSGFKLTDTEAVITGSLIRVAGEDVGMYAIQPGTIAAGPNYTINFTSADFEISPATLTVTTDPGQTKIYGNGDPVFTYQVTGYQNGDDETILTGALTRAAGEDVGTYTITLGTLDAGPNYVINFTSADFEITPATLVITADAGQSKVYGDADPVFTYQYSGLKNGDTDAVITGSLIRVAGEDVGTYAIQPGTIAAGLNYVINFTSADFAITPATLVITADAGQSKVYGEADPVFTYQSSGFKLTDTEAVITGSLIRVAGEDVGMYAIQPGTIAAGPNYAINFTSADFAITPATLDVTADAGQIKVYGDADPVFTFVADGFEAGDDETILTGALSRVAGEDVGSYVINLGTLDAGPNYTINFTGADFTITPRTLNITANANQAKVYGSADPVFAYSVSNFGNGDNTSILTGALSRVAGENVGMYAITIGTLDAGMNYVINFTSADFEIAEKVLDVTADAGQSKVFGTADPTLAYQVTGFENGDDETILTGSLARAAGENVGSYAINLGSLNAGSNYAINYTGANFTITKATITGITFADGSFVFDGTEKSLMISGTLPAGTSVVYSNNGRTDVGSQEVTATITGSNYTTLELMADLTITPAEIGAILFSDASFVYDGTEKSLMISGTLPAGTSVVYSNNGRTDVGSQEVTATITGSNYTTLELTADLTITPAEIGAITFNDASFVYDGTEKSLMISGTLPAGTSVAYSNNGRTDVGSQEVTATITGSNYTTLELTADLTITAKEITVTADAGLSKIAGEADPILTYTATGLADGEGMEVFAGSLSRASGEDVGLYAITQGTLSAGDNYTINFIGADFEIIDGDTDGDGVPDQQEEEDGTDPSDPTDFKDTDLDGVPDYVEEEQGTDPADPEDYKDQDGDKVPDYVEVQQGTDPNNPDDAQDSDEDGVPDYIQERSIVELVAQSIQVAWNTPEASLNLPTEAVAITGLGEVVNVPVTWDLTGYDPLTSGTTGYDGEITEIAGVFNTYGLTAELSIEVLAKPAPTDVTLSENEFIGIPDQYFQEIGFFTVIDATDDQHTLSLPEGMGDNELFEVIDGILFWSSQDQRAGETQFEVVLQVEDRGGNVIQKSFQITRQRTPLSQLDVVNTFTPNADGVNDTWGVPALRYYSGVRIQVFDRGGRRLFYTEDPDVRWDGTFEGEEMGVGAYFWVIEVEETGEVRRGILNLLKH